MIRHISDKVFKMIDISDIHQIHYVMSENVYIVVQNKIRYAYENQRQLRYILHQQTNIQLNDTSL